MEEKNMFENIGGKIKILAKVICWIGIIASVISAIALWVVNSRYNPTIALGFGVLIGGCLASWIGSFFAYGFGELVDYASQELSKNPQSEHIKFDSWQCSQCGTINSGSSCSKCNKKKSAFDRKCA